MYRLVLTLLACLALATKPYAQTTADIVPLDPSVRHGQLSNGLTYYIRHNDVQPQRADFYIAQRVGSILEEDHQSGLAHFLEHMAFHHTKNFPDNSLIGYLESNGVQFGSNLNASTSVDQTVYNIANVPVTRTSLVDSCLLVLHDWSGFIELDDKTIDEERRVIQEEWRQRNTADQRLFLAQLPQVYPEGCRYAERNPIGSMDVVAHFPYQALRDYYHRWYRPDLQAIIVVGDVDVDYVEQRLREMWTDIPAPVQPAKREYLRVPAHKGVKIGISSDPEAQSNSLEMLFNHDRRDREQRSNLREMADDLIRSIITRMINSRLEEYVHTGRSPFLNAATLDGDFLLSGSTESWGLGAGFSSGKWRPALDGLVAEAKRVRDLGFLPSEYERAKSAIETSIEEGKSGVGNTRNGTFVQNYLGHFLQGDYCPSPEQRLDYFLAISDTLSLSCVNAVARQLFRDDNQVLMLMGIEQAAVPMPSREEVHEAYAEAWTQAVEQYVDSIGTRPLLAEDRLPLPGTIVKETRNEALGYTTWLLSNGATVVLKQTDFSKNNITLRAVSPGGTSVYEDRLAPTYGSINSVCGLGGLGSLSAIELTRLLEGKNAHVSFSVETTKEQLYGSCSPTFLTPMMQMTHLVFLGAREDMDAFQKWKTQVRPVMHTRDNSAEAQLQDSINHLLYPGNVRYQSFKAPMLDRVNYRKALEMFSQRYSNASDFTFFIIGHYDEAILRPLVCQYLASIPGTGKKEKAKDVIPYLKKGEYICHFEREMETPRSTVALTWGGKMKYTLHNRMCMNIVHQVLDMIYMQTLRGEEGGTYGAQASYDLTLEPRDQYMFNVNFQTNAEKLDIMLQRAKDGLRQIAEEGITEQQMDKVVTYMHKRHNDLLRTNAYWLQIMQESTLDKIDNYTHYDRTLDAITRSDIQQCARQIISSPTFIEVVMQGVKR